ncbi:DUF4232 domain-containing protein [Actinomadura darangshiensis]|uniref:DUF4232 domain-containing protein n=1 Tax=Actinomadura darangshiensis TaxID=705336 RepID=A0A4R5BIU7_9ACTN|nr:DUF4232 domain-containing protein [Actinomadura darangshiensis]TDD84880.1 DUF4232 domain-containing protein [Actinomadura darangshiensis]
MPRLILGTLAAAAVATALAGCGSASNASPASAGGSGSSTPPGTSSTAANPGSPGGATGSGGANGGSGNANAGGGANPGRPQCTAGMLDASLTDLGAAAGNRYATLVLTNKSGKHCTTGGWSGLQLAGAGGTVPTKVVREGTPHTITIRNGGHAYERLHWAAVPAGDETGDNCEPVASVLRVIPPNRTEQTDATWKYGPACQHGQIRLTPLTSNPEPR